MYIINELYVKIMIPHFDNSDRTEIGSMISFLQKYILYNVISNHRLNRYVK